MDADFVRRPPFGSNPLVGERMAQRVIQCLGIYRCSDRPPIDIGQEGARVLACAVEWIRICHAPT